MRERQIKTVIAALLHDVGKIVYRTGEGIDHCKSGRDFLNDKCEITDSDILDPVLYHHGKRLRNADIPNDDISYIVYIADNISAAADRCNNESGEDGFDRTVPLESIFNVLNGNNAKAHYERRMLDPEKGICFPTEDAVKMDDAFYSEVCDRLADCLRGIEISAGYINSLISVLEATTSYIPSSTSKSEYVDISLFDHLKMTAAIASCIEQYTDGNKDLKTLLFNDAESFYKEKAFLLCSADMSGIQKFIYTISSKGALKGLRARSFYLDVLMEDIMDDIFDACGVTRANLIYSGGGHAYFILPATDDIRRILNKVVNEINYFLAEIFDTSLYLACGYTDCSALELQNKPDGAYSNLFRTVSNILSDKKLRRYSADEIKGFNSRRNSGDRECVICHRTEKINDDGKCYVCAELEKMSAHILRDDFFAVLNADGGDGLPLPGGRLLRGASESEMQGIINKDKYVRCYSKNKLYTGKFASTRLWIGDYGGSATFDDLASGAEGIERIGVLRADVDNLGSAFVGGFKYEGKKNMESLSRTATLSRQLSMFFKCEINAILNNGVSDIFKTGSKARRVVIVYSGGDDLFIVGAWNDCMEAFIDIRDQFRIFTNGTLSISGGMGLYRSGYPIHIMAQETACLEDASKNIEGKDAITLFESENSFKWDEFKKEVLEDKYLAISHFFESSSSISDANYGKAFLYRLLDLLRESREKINRARYIYLLSRMEPKGNMSQEIKTEYRRFADKMYAWYADASDRKELITAIYLYVYHIRITEGK